MIQFNKIRKTYPKQVGSQAHIALQDISFSLKQGKTLGLVGANGAGKSTSICLLMDFIRPDQGTIRVFGKPPNDPDVRLKIGYLPEKTAFPANLNVLDMLQFAGRTCRMSKSDITAAGKKMAAAVKPVGFSKTASAKLFQGNATAGKFRHCHDS